MRPGQRPDRVGHARLGRQVQAGHAAAASRGPQGATLPHSQDAKTPTLSQNLARESSNGACAGRADRQARSPARLRQCHHLGLSCDEGAVRHGLAGDDTAKTIAKPHRAQNVPREASWHGTSTARLPGSSPAPVQRPCIRHSRLTGRGIGRPGKGPCDHRMICATGPIHQQTCGPK